MVVQNIRNNGAGVDNTKLGGVGQVVAKTIRRINWIRSKKHNTRIYAKRRNNTTAF